MSFKFLGYELDKKTGLASFNYQSEDDKLTEKVQFEVEPGEIDEEALNRAMFLAFIAIGTSYYKARAGQEVELETELTKEQANFFTKMYQEGMSQFAFENGLTRDNLAKFEAKRSESRPVGPAELSEKSLVTISGGKDSLLSAEIISEGDAEWRAMYITAQESYPSIIDKFGKPIIVRRFIDKEGLKKIGGMNGHVPVTIINEAISLVQAILINANHVEFGIGEEGIEPHAFIGDLPVNHQWSKTPEAQDLIHQYVKRFIASNLSVGSMLSRYSELEIAEMFAKKCWKKYGTEFSSCNVANYKQDADNRTLKWCGKCAKCANSYLLFAPFVPCAEQKKLFGHDLFEDPELTRIFMGLLGVDGVMKPFECVASTTELKWAYTHKLPGYGDLPFVV